VNVVHLKLNDVVESQEPPVLVAASPAGFQIATAHLARNDNRHVVHVQRFTTRGMYKIMDTSGSVHGGYEAKSIQSLEFGPCGKSLAMLVDHSKLLVWILRFPFQGAATLSLPVPGLTASHAVTTFLPDVAGMVNGQVSNRMRFVPAELVFSHDGSMLAVSYRDLRLCDLSIEDVKMDVWTLYGHKNSGQATTQAPLQVTWKGLHLVSLSENGSKCAIVTQADCNNSVVILVWNVGEDIGRNLGKDRLQEEALTYQVIDHDGCIGEVPIAIAFSGAENEEDVVVVCNAEGALIWLQTGHKGQTHASNMGACPGAICRISSDGKCAAILKDSTTLEVWNLEKKQIKSTHCVGAQLGVGGAMVASDGMFFDGRLMPDGRDHFQYWLQQIWHITEEDRSLRSQDVVFVGLEDDRTILVGSDCGALALIPRDKCYKEDVESNTSGPVRVKLLRHTCSGLEFNKFGCPILAVSGNGRVVAGMLEYGSVRVWTPFSTSLSLPDYRQLELEQCILQKNVTRLQKLLALHGIAILNHPGDDGMTIFLRAVKENNQEWVEAMLKWAETIGSTVCLRPLTGCPSQLNALDLAIQNRNDKIADMLLDAMFNRLVEFPEASDVLRNSFLALQTFFPKIAYKKLSSDAMLLSMGKLEVSVAAFGSQENMVVGTHDRVCSSIKMDDKSWEAFGYRIVHVSQSRYVLSLWRQHWKLYSPQKTDEGLSKSKMTVSCKAIPFLDIAQVDICGILRQLKLANFDTHALDCKVLQGVISFKWNLFARRLVLRDLAWHFALILVYSGTVVTQKSADANGSETHPSLLVLQIVGTWTIASVAASKPLNLARLYSQLRTRYKARRQMLERITGDRSWKHFLAYEFWAYSNWEVLDITVYFFMIVSLLPTYSHEFTDDSLQWTSPLAFLLLWWKMMYYGQAFQNTGPLVITIFQIFSDISFFLMLLVANFAGFTFAFYVLFIIDRREICNSAEIDTEEGASFCDAFGGWGRTAATVFVMMLGEFDPETFFTSSNSAVAVAFLVIYLLLSAVLLLNLLIAIIGDSFDRVKRHETAHFLKGRAQVIQAMEDSLWPWQEKTLREKIGRYLYVLVPENQCSTSSKDKWQGKIAEMEKVFK